MYTTDMTTQHIRGKVRHGKKRGRELGFPTANIELHRSYPEGIFVSQTSLDGKTYQSVTFIGAAKTFDEKDVLAETFILDFDQDIYGKLVYIRLLKKLRDNQKFSGMDTLIQQIHEDVERTRHYFLDEGAAKK
jgi:riboflavin kinase / FMN adenylyltransferase